MSALQAQGCGFFFLPIFAYQIYYHFNNTDVPTWNAVELQKARNILSGSLALYDLCAHSLWAPAVMPRAAIVYTNSAERK